MIVLRRLVIAVILSGVLQLLKWLLNMYSPESQPFHTEFIWTLQVLVIAWLVITSILAIFRKENSWFARFVPVFLVLLTIVIDMWFSYQLTHPEKISPSMLPFFKKHYKETEGKDLRYEPCTVYDSLKGMRITRSVGFTFGNIEYNNEYRVNSESLRDTEDDLFGPGIICAGNTLTFGCGVDANQTYADKFGRDTEKKLLNVGVINNGTATQLSYLENVDTSVLEYLVIQYSFDDAESNSSYLRGSDTAHRSEHDFVLQRKKYHWAREYFPGKHAILILSDKVGSWFSEDKEVITEDELNRYATDLLNTLAKLVPKTRFRVIIAQVDRLENMNTGFIQRVDSLLLTPAYKEALSNVSTIDLSKILRKEDYYKLDMHLKPAGHEKVAGQLWDKFVELEK